MFLLRSSVSPVSTIKQDLESGVVSLCWTEIPDQNMFMNFSILAATIRSFKMLIDYTLDLNPPLFPLPPIPPSKEREEEEIALKFPLVLAHVVTANTPSKFFRLHLGTNFLSFDWDLSAFSFSNLFLFSRSGRPLRSSPARPSKLPAPGIRAVPMVIPWTCLMYVKRTVYYVQFSVRSSH